MLKQSGRLNSLRWKQEHHADWCVSITFVHTLYICIHMYPHELILSEQCRKRVRTANSCHIRPHQYAVGHRGRVIPTHVRNLGKAYASNSNFTVEEDEKIEKGEETGILSLSSCISECVCVMKRPQERSSQLDRIDNDLLVKSKWNIPLKETNRFFC